MMRINANGLSLVKNRVRPVMHRCLIPVAPAPVATVPLATVPVAIVRGEIGPVGIGPVGIVRAAIGLAGRVSRKGRRRTAVELTRPIG